MSAFACPACGTDIPMKDSPDAEQAACPRCGRVGAAPAPCGDGPSSYPPTRVMAGQPVECLDNDSTEFLAPPQADGELGRLGRYRIVGVLCRGGMGVVFEAEDPALRRRVALKAMLPGVAASASAGVRFLREAQAMAAVEHDHIVRIYEVSEDRGVPFLAMEFLKGETLEDRLRREGKLSPSEAVRIGREVAEALAAAHATGLIHRDVKPANVWLESPAGRVKILDFGLARAAASRDAGLTQQGVIIGTPAYMAPEQARGEPVEPRSDLFSLGCVLFRMIEGRVPFQGADAVSTLLAVVSQEPRLDADVPEALSSLVRRLLEKSPDQRPPSAAWVAEAFRATEAGKSVPASPRAKSGRRGLLLAVAVLAGLSAGAWWWVDHVARPPRIDPANETPSVATGDPEPKAPPKGGSLVLAGPARSAEPDRRAAEYVLSLGGTVRVDAVPGREIAAPADLPRAPFRLTGVTLDENPHVNDEGMAAFGGCTNLTSLRMPFSPVGDAGLAHFEGCKGLTRLDLSGTRVSDAGLIVFAGCTNLAELRLSATKVTDEGLALFADCKDIEILELNRTRVGDDGLARLGVRKNLRSLALDGTQVSDAGLARLGGCKGLTSLSLSGTRVSNTGLATFENCKGLTRLRLEGTQVGDAGLFYFRRCKGLTHLYLSGTRVGDAGLAHVEGCRGLIEVALSDTKVSDLSPLVGNKLKTLFIDRTQVSDLSPLERMPLEEITCDFQVGRDAEILRSLTSLKKINDRPAKDFWRMVDATKR